MMQRVLVLFVAMLCVANGLVQSGLAMKSMLPPRGRRRGWASTGVLWLSTRRVDR